MVIVAVSIVVVSISTLIALLNIDERCTVLGAVHGPIGSIFLIAFGAVRIGITRIAAFIAVAVAIMLIATLQTVLIDAALEVAILNALVELARCATLIAVAIEVVSIVAAIALLTYVAWTAAIIAYAVCITVLDFIGHAALWAVLEHTRFFATFIAVAISVVLFTVLRTIRICTLLIWIGFRQILSRQVLKDKGDAFSEIELPAN